MIREIATKPLLWAYRLANNIGILRTPIARAGYIRSYFFYKRHIEDPFFSLSKKHPELFKNGHILDIGANIGYTSVIFSTQLSQGFQVHAFEPDPSNFEQLLNVIKIYRSSNLIKCTPSAVGTNNGEIKFWVNPHQPTDCRVLTPKLKDLPDFSDTNVISVPIQSIDNYRDSTLHSQPIAFIKIDVQGFELAVAQGMQQTLLANPEACIVFELHAPSLNAAGTSTQKLLEFFENLEYRFFRIQKNGELLETDANKLIDDSKNVYFDVVCRKAQP
jgi:FkbM family methyltransferase